MEQQSDAVKETLERLEVADTLEELRHHIDELIDQLSEKERAAAAGGEAISPELEGQIEDLGDKVESASNLLAELTDLLEAQTERIETIEQQLGDPDLAGYEPDEPPPRGPAPPEPSIPRFTMRPPARAAIPAVPEPAADRSDLTIALQEYLDIRLERVESGIRQIEERISEIRGAAEGRDRQVRELEDRLLILVDSGVGPEKPAGETSGNGARFAADGASFPNQRAAPQRRYDVPLVAPKEPRPPHMPLFAHISAGHYALAARRANTLVGAAVPNGMPLAARAPYSIGVAHAGESQTLLPLRVATGAGIRESATAPAVPLRVTDIGAQREAEPQPAAPPSRMQPSPEPAALSAFSEPMRELEKLVEREVRLRLDFTSPDDTVRPARAHPTVLVIDDSPDAVKMVSIYLSKTGFQVVTASSAEDGLAKLRHHAIDALVLDAKLPGANGGHVCRVLQEDPAYAARRHIPVIIYTGCPEEYPSEVRARWRADEYVVKGGDMLPLITALVRHTNPNARP